MTIGGMVDTIMAGEVLGSIADTTVDITIHGDGAIMAIPTMDITIGDGAVLV